MSVPLQWTGERDGQYRGTFVSTEAGAYEVTVDATRAAARPSAAASPTCAPRPSDAEYFDPTMHAAPLRRIAEETGGRFYTPDTATGLAEDVRYAGRGVTSVEERELWNMPIILITLMGLVCAEWGYRRVVGLGLMLKAFLLIVVGLAGDPEHGKTFHKWGTTLAEASERLGVPPERLVYLVDQPAEGDERRHRPRDARRDRQGARWLRQAGRSRGRRLRHAHRPRQLRRPRRRSSICRAPT